MSMLSRYKKAGGFVQLLNLIETRGPEKREKFLQIIEEESPYWAEAIREKLLSIDRILTWDENILGEIAVRLPELALATFLHGIQEEHREKILSTFTHTQRRHIDDFFDSKTPSAGEINATLVKLLELTRHMITEGEIKLDRVDPGLAIHEDIEEELIKKDNEAKKGDEDTAHLANIDLPDVASGQSGPGNTIDLTKIKQKLTQLSKENHTLKQENRVLQEKIAQIRKIV
ncbi:MAG: hypothetical protein KDD59_11770 [Bdellovibrionales bacterium]|nr:hypothetical protein [Bdellovibrionales bacterium]